MLTYQVQVPCCEPHTVPNKKQNKKKVHKKKMEALQRELNLGPHRTQKERKLPNNHTEYMIRKKSAPAKFEPPTAYSKEIQPILPRVVLHNHSAEIFVFIRKNRQFDILTKKEKYHPRQGSGGSSRVRHGQEKARRKVDLNSSYFEDGSKTWSKSEVLVALVSTNNQRISLTQFRHMGNVGQRRAIPAGLDSARTLLARKITRIVPANLQCNGNIKCLLRLFQDQQQRHHKILQTCR